MPFDYGDKVNMAAEGRKIVIGTWGKWDIMHTGGDKQKMQITFVLSLSSCDSFLGGI